jgi:hypothetical protein
LNCKVNEKTNQILRTVDLSNNPTIYYADLVIDPGVLENGLYKFVYEVNMTSSNAKCKSDTYTKIIPSGIVVFGLKNGIGETSIGKAQSLKLEPAINSYDIDKIAKISQLDFRFYCQVKFGPIRITINLS